MLLSISHLEWIGYIGSVIIAISLTMSSILKLRWFNLLGAAIFAFYGFALGALPVGILNLFIVLANVFYLAKISAQKEVFKAMRIPEDDWYLSYFLSFYKKNILQYFPDFEKDIALSKKEKKELFTFFLLRNATVAGIFIGAKEGNQVAVFVDFVIPEYRDFKAGKFVYSNKHSLFEDEGIDTITCTNTNVQHSEYLLKMGFYKGQNNVFVKR